ncbi:MAG TPA: hypothetical protein VGF21_10260 [Thermoleophilaceae bacterium]|jgi:chaperonin cofactor prefoldin
MAKHEERAEQLEREAERLEEQGDRIDRRIDESRSDWESKEQDPSVPGAQAESNVVPDEDEEEDS